MRGARERRGTVERVHVARVHRDRLARHVLLEADRVERRAPAPRHGQVDALAVHHLLRPRVYEQSALVRRVGLAGLGLDWIGRWDLMAP